MKFIFPIVSSLVFIIGMSFVARLVLKYGHKRLWHIPVLTKIADFLPWTTVVFQVIWLTGIVTGLGILYIIGGTLTTLVIFIIAIILLSVPLSIWIYKLLAKPVKADYDPARRKFLKTTTGILPVAAVSFAGTGMVKSFNAVQVPVIPLPVQGLPQQLAGLRIAHLSDLHLGYYFGPDELEQVLIEIDGQQPDIFFLTGDIADELHLLRPALDMIAGLNTPFNGFASVGNHEYYRGIKKIVDIFDKSPVPLLLEETASISINGVPVVIGGADDPVSHRPDMQRFLDRTVTKTFQDTPDAAFRILLSHRPKGFRSAQKLGIELTLAGHSHGGQLGFSQHSAFDVLPIEMYLWGQYHENGKTLYTTSGMGHWFPFRLGCPAEAPILELQPA